MSRGRAGWARNALSAERGIGFMAPTNQVDAATPQGAGALAEFKRVITNPHVGCAGGRIVELAARNRLTTIYVIRWHTAASGLVFWPDFSYGPDMMRAISKTHDKKYGSHFLARQLKFTPERLSIEFDSQRTI